MTAQDSPLLLTKLYAPVPRRTHVVRLALLEQLESGLDGKLIAVVAAAGFGKTTLLAEWCDQHAGEVGWLSLDERDNEPLRFFIYLVAAIQSVQAQFAERLSQQLQSPPPPGIEDILHMIINQLAALPKRLIVVLDDYHAIDNPAIHAAMAFLLDYLSPQITFVLATRSDPPLPLARLRAGNDLLELRADRLRFSIEESAQFLNQSMQIPLPMMAVEALDRRTEGWITGLQLAALAMQTFTGDLQEFIANFTGSHRFILDYLIEEVLSQQTEHVQQFLRYTAILSRFNAALCQAITGDADSQAMLDFLDKHNLFLVALDQSRQWYRYHHLFAELLQARLQTEPAPLRQDLYRRAADWYAANGMAEDAVSYALAAQAFETATALIGGAAAGAVQRGDVFTLLNWYKAFPPDIIARQPVLSLQFGIAFALNGRWQEAESLLNQVENHPESPLEARMMLTYLVGSYRHDAKRLARVAEAAGDDPVIFLARALLASLRGELRAANALLLEARLRSEHVGNRLMAITALFHQCRFDVFLGELRQTQTLSQQALAQVTGQPLACFAYTALGRVMIEQNDLAAAADYLSKAIRLSELTGFVTGMLSSATMMQAEVQQGLGDSMAANLSAQAALNHARRNDPPNEVLWLQTYQARLWLIQGNIEAAADWLHHFQQQALPDSIFYPASVVVVTHARLLLAQRQFDPAVALLTHFLTGTPDLFTVEALAVLAMARQATGNSVNALLTLEQALSMAEVENRIRAFLDLGAPLAQLLGRYFEVNPAHGYAKTLLNLFQDQAPLPQALGERLSDRELEVLQLIVAGYSNDEIAHRLIIAVSTVKWYVNTLFGKLHVKTRAQAIAQAHTLKLFE